MSKEDPLIPASKEEDPEAEKTPDELYRSFPCGCIQIGMLGQVRSFSMGLAKSVGSANTNLCCQDRIGCIPVPRIYGRLIFGSNIAMLLVLLPVRAVNLSHRVLHAESSHGTGRTGMNTFLFGLSAMNICVGTCAPLALLLGIWGTAGLYTIVQPREGEKRLWKYGKLRQAHLDVAKKWEKRAEFARCDISLLILTVLGIGGVVAEFLLVYEMFFLGLHQDVLRHPDENYLNVTQHYFCKFQSCAETESVLPSDTQLMFFFALTCSVGFVCVLGLRSMWMSYQVCRTAIKTVIKEFHKITPRPGHAERYKGRYLPPAEAKKRAENFGLAAKSLRQLNAELAAYWAGWPGRAWMISLFIHFSVVVQGVNALMINLLQKRAPHNPEDPPVHKAFGLAFVLGGGFLFFVTVYAMTKLTSKCGSSTPQSRYHIAAAIGGKIKGKKREIVGAPEPSLFLAVDAFVEAWMTDQDEDKDDSSWLARIMTFQTWLSNQKMGVNLVGVQFMDMSFLTNLIVKAAIVAPTAFTFLSTFMGVSSQHHSQDCESICAGTS